MKPYILYDTAIIAYFISGAIAASGYFIDSTWPFFIIDLNCIGEEDSIWNCSHNRLLKYNCPFGHDASLQCQGNHINLLLQCMKRNDIIILMNCVIKCSKILQEF